MDHEILFFRKLQWDGSNANLITEPKTDPDINAKVDACLELIGYFKSEKPPSGVNLDKTKVDNSICIIYFLCFCCSPFFSMADT